MINPKMVAALGGSRLVAAASLQINDTGGHIRPLDRAIFVVIARQDRKTGLSKRTHQMAYVCQKTEDLVSSREAMTSLGMVKDNDDSAAPAASVHQISSCAPSSGCGPECSGCSGGGPSCLGDGRRQEEGVSGGQLTLDLMASHNQSYADNQVSPGMSIHSMILIISLGVLCH